MTLILTIIKNKESYPLKNIGTLKLRLQHVNENIYHFIQHLIGCVVEDFSCIISNREMYNEIFPDKINPINFTTVASYSDVIYLLKKYKNINFNHILMDHCVSSDMDGSFICEIILLGNCKDISPLFLYYDELKEFVCKMNKDILNDSKTKLTRISDYLYVSFGLYESPSFNELTDMILFNEWLLILFDEIPMTFLDEWNTINKEIKKTKNVCISINNTQRQIVFKKS